MEINNIILLAIAIPSFLCGFYFLYRIKLCRDYNLNSSNQKIAIIIPARNEEHNIGNLLSSIKQQTYKVDEVIVVNDSSTDSTKEVAESLGAIVLESAQLPEGWKGKPWACWQGAQFSSSDVFIFLDADTIIEPARLKNIVDSYLFELQESEKSNGVVMSIAPFHKIEKLYEELSAIFNIIMVGSMNAFTPFKSNQPTGLYGQSLIVSKKNYFEIEGHSSVKNKILENVFMAQKFQEKGTRLVCLGGKGSLSFRMYPDGFRALIDGWTKAFASGAGQASLSALLTSILWISAGFIISIALLFNLFVGDSVILWLILYVAYSLQTYWMLRRLGSFSFLTALLFPVNLVFYVIVFSRSLYYLISKKSINWKSRNVNS
jgi:4,4'-diaponeurosporenoate glycosyltransferase